MLPSHWIVSPPFATKADATRTKATAIETSSNRDRIIVVSMVGSLSTDKGPVRLAAQSHEGRPRLRRDLRAVEDAVVEGARHARR
jgi:hypothetical protein